MAEAIMMFAGWCVGFNKLEKMGITDEVVYGRLYKIRRLHQLELTEELMRGCIFMQLVGSVLLGIFFFGRLKYYGNLQSDILDLDVLLGKVWAFTLFILVCVGVFIDGITTQREKLKNIKAEIFNIKMSL